MGSGITLDTANTKVTTEHRTNENRHIDIVIEDDKTFISIEVKIGAGEQKDQIKDYAQYTRKKNENRHVPVLYLTLDGHKSKTAADTDYVAY